MAGRSSLFPVVVAFTLGVLLGAAGMYTGLRHAPEQTVAQAPPTQSAPDETPRSPPGSGVVSVTLSNGNLDVHGSGLAVAGEHVVVVPLAGFRPATRGSWRGADGRTRRLNRAVAWDFDLGLAVFDVGDVGRDGLDLSPEDGSLFLGRQLAFVTPAGRRSGYVDSPAVASPFGGYRYRVAVNSPLSLRGAALLQPGTRTLLGLALPADDAPMRAADAIDASALRDLIEQRDRTVALSVTELSEAYLDSWPGLRATLAAHLAAGRWEAGADAAQRLITLHPGRVDEEAIGAAINAYVNWTEYHLEAGEVQRAIEIADEAESLLGERALLRLNRARALSMAGDSAAAVLALLAFIERNPAGRADEAWATLRERLRALIEREVASTAMSAQAAIDLLERALASDDFAGYHRYLGERLYAQGRYVEAETSLARAVALDPSYAPELEYALEESRQRRSTASLIEVPMQAVDNAIFVTVRINGRPELYRFLLDTGATYSALSMRTLLRLGLETVLYESGAPIQLETANGRVSASAIRVASIDLSGAIVQQVPVVVLEELGDIDGLLGLSFLSHFDLEINQRDSKLLLTPR